MAAQLVSKTHFSACAPSNPTQPSDTPAVSPSVYVPQLLNHVPVARVRFVPGAATAPPVRNVFPKENAVVGGTSNRPNRPMIYGHYAPQAQTPRRSVGVGFTNPLVSN